MYKIDICLHYMPCANCWVCMNHTKPNRPRGPNSKARELLETALCRTMPSGWHGVSSVQRVAQARPRPRSWNGLQMCSSTPSFCGQEAPGQGFRELARVTQHLQAEPHLGHWLWPLLLPPHHNTESHCTALPPWHLRAPLLLLATTAPNSKKKL